MDSRRILFLAAATGLFFLALPSAHAQTIVTYSGSDPGAGPRQPDPMTTAARAAFTAAAAGFGPATLLTFESSNLGSTTFTTSGVQVTGTNNSGGVSNGGDAIVGYNTTAGGAKFLQLSSNNDSKAVTEVFDFTGTTPYASAGPITAFGADFTGVGTETGTTTITFSDGSKETETLPGSTSGGVEFFGFTDTKGLAIQSVTVGVFPVSGGTTDDLIGIDDVLLYDKVPPASAAPEPSQIATLSLGVLLFGGLILTARKRRAAQPA